MKSAFALGLLACLAGCSAPLPNSQLIEAQSHYRQAQQDKALQAFRPASLSDGYQWLQRAEQLHQDKEPPEEVGHAAYMAERLLDIAKEQSLQHTLANQYQSTEQRLSQIQQQQYEESVRQAEQAEADKQRKQAEAKQRAEAEQKSRQEAYHQALEAMEAEQLEQGFLVSFDTSLFAQGKTELGSQADGKIDSLAQFLIRYPDHQIRIQGFSSQGSAKQSQQQATQAAQSLYRALLFRAIQPERMKFEGKPSTESHGKLGKNEQRIEVILQAKAKQA